MGGGNRNAAGTGPAFAGGIGSLESASNMPASAFGPAPPGMPSVAQINPSTPSALTTDTTNVAKVANALQPLLANLPRQSQAQPRQQSRFQSPQMSYVPPPQDPLAAMYAAQPGNQPGPGYLNYPTTRSGGGFYG